MSLVLEGWVGLESGGRGVGRRNNDMKKKQSRQIKVDADVHADLKLLAAKTGRTINFHSSTLLREILPLVLERAEKEKLLPDIQYA